MVRFSKTLLVSATLAALVPAAALGQQGAMRVAERCGPDAPFGVAARPLPQGAQLDQLLPLKVGSFTREAIAPGQRIPTDEDFNVTYQSGRDSVFLGISRLDKREDRHEAVRTTYDEAVADRRIDRKGEQGCLGNDMSFYRLRHFYSWTRGSYFIYLDASSPKALDSFMAAFPY